MVAAHGVHGKVDVPLPTLNGHGELTALASTKRPTRPRKKAPAKKNGGRRKPAG